VIADPRQALAELIRERGRAVLEDPGMLEALLRARCPQRRLEVTLLVNALREGVPSALLQKVTTGMGPATMATQSARLVENLGISDSLARWAVESWAKALAIPAIAPGERPAPHVPGQADAAQGRKALSPDALRSVLRTPRRRKASLAIFVAASLFLLVHDWSGGRVDSAMTGKWRTTVTDGVEDWLMSWDIKTKGTYVLQMAMNESGEFGLLGNAAFKLVPKESRGKMRIVQFRVESQKKVYFSGALTGNAGGWSPWTYEGKGATGGVTLVGAWKSEARAPGFRGIRILEIDGHGGYKLAALLEATGAIVAKNGEFALNSQYDDYGDKGKYASPARNKLAIASQRYRSVVWERAA
jgi:hypothetical protein